RSDRDWSSDVCSSDLWDRDRVVREGEALPGRIGVEADARGRELRALRVVDAQADAAGRSGRDRERELSELRAALVVDGDAVAVRSEERRVGIEWRGRG